MFDVTALLRVLDKSRFEQKDLDEDDDVYECVPSHTDFPLSEIGALIKPILCALGESYNTLFIFALKFNNCSEIQIPHLPFQQ